GIAGLPGVKRARSAHALALPFRSPLGHAKPTPAGRKTPRTATQKLTQKVTKATGGGSGVRPASGAHAFNGLSDQDSFRLNGFPVTPPDQGLCVGRDGSLRGRPEAVWEPINLAARETTE